MPAVSKKQAAFMAIAEHEPSKLRGKKPNMSKSQLHDFAATPRKNLPERAKAAASMIKRPTTHGHYS